MNYLAFDIGGTNTKYALVSDKGIFLFKEEVSTPSTYRELIKLVIDVYKANNVSSEMIGLSCPGIYDPEVNMITGSSALDYLIDNDIISDIKVELPKVDIVIENDGNCALLGEYWIGNAEGRKNAAIIVVGSAIGGGAVVNNRLLRGANLNAGEFGYMLIDNSVSELSFKSLGGKGGLNGLIGNVNRSGFSVTSGKDLFEQMKFNKSLEQYVEQQLLFIAVGIVNLQYIIDPEIVIIGGAISRNDYFIELVQHSVGKLMATRPLYKVKPTVMAAKFGNDANLLGIVYKAKVNVV